MIWLSKASRHFSQTAVKQEKDGNMLILGYSWMSLGCSNTKRLTVRILQTYGKDLHEGLHL